MTTMVKLKLLKDWKTTNNFYNFVKGRNFDKDFFLEEPEGFNKSSRR